MTEVTLSFDNGPDPEATPHVLDVLADKGVLSSFFVLGHKLANPSVRALAERAAAEGHWIANHTYHHAVPLGQISDAGHATQEIRDTQALIGPLAHADRLFRPFGGGGKLGPHLLNGEALELLQAERMTCVLWNAIPRDWEDADGWPERALAQISTLDHALVVLHDLPTGAMRHLASFIDRVRASGHSLRQGFPADCLPLVRGHCVQDMDAFTT